MSEQATEVLKVTRIQSSKRDAIEAIVGQSVYAPDSGLRVAVVEALHGLSLTVLGALRLLVEVKVDDARRETGVPDDSIMCEGCGQIGVCIQTGSGRSYYCGDCAKNYQQKTEGL